VRFPTEQPQQGRPNQLLSQLEDEGNRELTGEVSVDKKSGFSRRRDQLLAKMFTAVPGLAARWGRAMGETSGQIPWIPALLPLRAANVALVTTGGVHLSAQEPFNMDDPHGDPSFREIPIDFNPENLRITHDYYNQKDAKRDINLVLPIDRLREMALRGAVGKVHEVAYSFMGHIDGSHIKTLVRETAPAVAQALVKGGADYTLLVPA
jgi:D-proline reductase (dithiol) PrdB